VTLPDPALLLITDRRQARGPLPQIVESACAAGCRWFSLREKDLPQSEQLRLARVLLAVARHWGARLILHGSAALADAAEVDGVHLPAGSDVRSARRLLGTRLVGVSIHNPGEARNLVDVDYAIAGPAFETQSKPGYGPPLGTEGFQSIVVAASVPIVAVGGITAEKVPGLLRAGAAGIAVMGTVMRAAAPESAVRGLVSVLRTRG
jgi:thiamine-phosphate pyrophosphorylase